MESRRKSNKRRSAPIVVTVDGTNRFSWTTGGLMEHDWKTLRCRIQRSSSNNERWVKSVVCCDTHPTQNPSIPVSVPPLYEVNAAAQLRPTNPSLLTAGVFAQGFKICPFIWAAQAGKWKGCQSSEPWEKCLVLTARVKTEGRAPSRQGNGLFLSRSSVEKWCKTASVGQWSSR